MTLKEFKEMIEREEGDRLYSLCQRYMSVWDNNDGYWLTVTELDMYEEIKRKHTELGILKKEG